ncbi:MAG: hypothetical protein EXS41_10850, partial [Opitutaceae bacterium]|nr:hypothetical protein [Opitutaceae bacterium]
ASGWRALPPCPGPARLLAVVGAVGDTFYVFSGVGLHAGPDGKPLRTYLKWTSRGHVLTLDRLRDLRGVCTPS